MQGDLPFKVGERFKFYGVDANTFKLGAKVFEAVEDESDGYRSYLGSVEVVEPEKLKAAVFFKRSLDEVEVIEDDGGYFNGYRLVSTKDKHEWLKFGTDNADDYYPSFVFTYTPRL